MDKKQDRVSHQKVEILGKQNTSHDTSVCVICFASSYQLRPMVESACCMMDRLLTALRRVSRQPVAPQWLLQLWPWALRLQPGDGGTTGQSAGSVAQQQMRGWLEGAVQVGLVGVA